MDYGNVGLAELRDVLATCERLGAHVRALLRRDSGGWWLHHASVQVDAEPLGEGEEVWEYEDVALVACDLSPTSLPVLCTEGDTMTLPLGGIDVHVPPVTEGATRQRNPSFTRHARVPLPCPATTYTVRKRENNYGAWPARVLVGAGCPSFPEYKSAWRAFSERNFSLAGAQEPPSDLAVIRIVETRGWIGPVHVSATAMTVEVRGDALAGCELELNSVMLRVVRELDGPCTVVIPLPDGLPGDAWLWLKSGATWLDYRSIDPKSAWTGDLKQAGVEIEVPVDPQANIEALIAAGEGPQVEFKEQLVEGRGLKAVAAFANGEGGTLVFGINRDEVTITGLTGDEPYKLRDRLEHLIRAAIVPTPDFSTQLCTIDDKVILVVNISPGKEPPYGIIAGPGARDKPDYYVRRGASTYPGQPSEIRAAVLGEPASGYTPPVGWRLR
jgi:Predicted transcriptional regulator containing an HTH domain and an uncharacterized domain shared with the mammalian protein Schlafen